MQNERLKLIRNILNLTQKEFADRINLNYETYKNYEYGIRDIPNIILDKFISVFNININWLVSGRGHKFFDETPEKIPLFYALDFRNNFEELLPLMSNPVVHIIVELTPSTNYNLPCLVLESIDTGEWYLFHRGRIAVQGAGGGVSSFIVLLNNIKNKNISLGKWALSNLVMSDFEAGLIMWPEIKKYTVPLLSVINNQDDWQSIIDEVKVMLNREYIEKDHKKIE